MGRQAGEWTDMQTERQAGRLTDMWTEGQTCRQVDRQADSWTHCVDRQMGGGGADL